MADNVRNAVSSAYKKQLEKRNKNATTPRQTTQTLNTVTTKIPTTAIELSPLQANTNRSNIQNIKFMNGNSFSNAVTPKTPEIKPTATAQATNTTNQQPRTKPYTLSELNRVNVNMMIDKANSIQAATNLNRDDAKKFNPVAEDITAAKRLETQAQISKAVPLYKELRNKQDAKNAKDKVSYLGDVAKNSLIDTAENTLSQSYLAIENEKDMFFEQHEELKNKLESNSDVQRYIELDKKRLDGTISKDEYGELWKLAALRKVDSNAVVRQAEKTQEEQNKRAEAIELNPNYADISDKEKIFLRGVGNVPSMAIGAAVGAATKNPRAGAAVMSAGAGGGEGQKALVETGDISKAFDMSVRSSALEMLTEEMFDVPFLGSGTLGIEEAITKGLKSEAGKKVVKRLTSIFGEGAEEVISAAAQPLIERAVYNPDAPFATPDELLESFIGGVVGAGILNTAGGVVNKIGGKPQKNDDLQNSIQNALNNPIQEQESVEVAPISVIDAQQAQIEAQIQAQQQQNSQEVQTQPDVSSNLQTQVPTSENKAKNAKLAEFYKQQQQILGAQDVISQSQTTKAQPQTTDNDTKTRKHAETIYNKGNLNEEQKADLKKQIENGDFAYEVAKNKKTQEAAYDSVGEKGIEKTQNDLSGLFDKNRILTPQDIAEAELLLKYYAENKMTEKFEKMATDLALYGTKTGQSIQAMSLIDKMTPQGKAYFIEKKIAKINETLSSRKGNKTKVEVSQELIDNYANAKTDAEIQAAETVIDAEILEQIPATKADQWNAFRYLSMLGNPRTHIRNVVGNSVQYLMRRYSNALATYFENIAHKASKGNVNKTRSLTTTKDGRAFAKEMYAKDKKTLYGGGKFDVTKPIQGKTNVFGKNGTKKLFPRFLNFLNNLNSQALEAEDNLFMKAAYVDAMAGWMKANNVTSDTITPKQIAKVRKYAGEQALEATFRSYSWLANKLNDIENKNAATKIIVGALTPFKKTPINIFKQGAKFSPIGLIKGIADVTYGVNSGKKTVNQAIDNIANGLSGTSILALGFFLASQGLLSASGSDDKEGILEKDQGKQNYSVKIGNQTITLDWLAPSSMPLFMGVELFNAFNQQGNGPTANGISAFLDSLSKVANPMVENSFMQGISDAISSMQYASSGAAAIGDLAVNLGLNYIGQAVPTVFGQIARTIDPVRRTTYASKDGLWQPLERWLRKNANKIPGLSMLMEPYVDLYGREQVSSNNWAERLFNNAVAPYYTAELKNDALANEVLSIYKQVGDNEVLPSAFNPTLEYDDNKYSMTPQEKTEAQKLYGGTIFDVGNQILMNPSYSKLDNEQRSAIFSDVNKLANEITRIDYFDKKGIEYEPKQKWIGEVLEYESIGGNIGDYFIVNKMKVAEGLKDADGKTIDNSEGLLNKKVIDSIVKDDDLRQVLYSAFEVGKKVASGRIVFDANGNPITQGKITTNVIRNAANYDVPDAGDETIDRVDSIGVSLKDYYYVKDRIKAFTDPIEQLIKWGFNENQINGLASELLMGDNAKQEMTVAADLGVSKNDYIAAWIYGYESLGSKNVRNAKILEYIQNMNVSEDVKPQLYEWLQVTQGKGRFNGSGGSGGSGKKPSKTVSTSTSGSLSGSFRSVPMQTPPITMGNTKFAQYTPKNKVYEAYETSLKRDNFMKRYL